MVDERVDETSGESLLLFLLLLLFSLLPIWALTDVQAPAVTNGALHIAS